MKLAAVYNVWDNWEMVEPSIESIYGGVDVVIVVAQRLSNWGKMAPVWQKLFLERMVRSGKIDELVWMEPKFEGKSWKLAQGWEKAKRQKGIDLSVEMGCTHFVGMDADEFYRPYEFQWMRKKIDEDDYLRSCGHACKIQVYYKDPGLKVEGLDNTWVPFICPLPARTGRISKANVLIDPTRITVDRYHPIDEREMVMHHMSWIRKEGIIDKLSNSTARMNIYKDAVIKEWEEAGPGTVLKEIYPGRKLISCRNEFI